MPLPDTPYTRKEAYLNAIATGDSGGIPETPYTREEMYLDAIAKGGGGGGGGGSSTLSGLTDVDISNPSDGQTLVYNATSEKWENGNTGPLRVNASFVGNSMVCDKTASEMLAAFQAGRSVIIILGVEDYMTSVVYADNTYLFIAYNGNEQVSFLASTGSDYPAFDDGPEYPQ